VIEVKAEQLEKAQTLLKHIPDAVPKVLSRAINRAAETARTEAARKVREKYYIGYGDVLKTINIRKASESSPQAIVTSRGHAVPLMAFRVTPNQPQKRKAPIVVRVKRGGGGPVRGGAFVGRMPSGHLGVFLRAGKRRLPINELFGPPIPEMLGSKDVAEWVEQKAQERLDERLDHEINRELEGYDG
jgi:hypothetical protein